MADAIDNLAQDLNQANAVDEFPGYPGYKMGDLVPNMAGVRVGDLFYGLDPYGQEAPYNWRTGGFEFQAAPQDLSNPSTLATGEGIDFNVRDQPVERINIGNTDEQDAFVGTGIGTPLDPVTQQRYNTTGTTPSPVGGVEYLTPKQIEDLTAGQTPSVPEGVVTRGEPVSIPGRTIPDYIPIGQMENGDVLYADRNNIRDTIIRPSAYSVSQEDLDKGVVPQKFNFGVNTAPSTSQVTPTPVESYQSVGAVEPTTTSVGGFDNTGGDVTVGPNIRGAGPGGSVNVTPGYVPKPEVKPGDEFKDSPYRIFDPTGKDDKLAPYTSPTGEVFPTDQNGYKWNYQTQQFDCVGGKCSEKNPVEDTPKPPVVTTPPTGGTKPPGGGGQPGGGTPGGGIPSGGGQPGRGPTIIPPREPVTPLIRRETVIPTKGTKEVPLPDRQADPFAKLYADLLANSQQQQDQYRYINYDPDQIMNAAMSGFRRRGAMRSLQG
jgi:hypothetical protein